jgi:hypothetical protein
MRKIFNKDGTLYIPISGKLRLPKDKIIEARGKAVITEAYCQKRHSLISDVKINDQNGLNFIYTDQERQKEAEIVISAVVGDRTKVNLDKTMFDKEEIVKILCPTCRNELPILFMCECGAPIYLIYLDERSNPRHAQSFCSRIGCTKASRLRFSQDALTEFKNRYSF